MAVFIGVIRLITFSLFQRPQFLIHAWFFMLPEKVQDLAIAVIGGGRHGQAGWRNGFSGSTRSNAPSAILWQSPLQAAERMIVSVRDWIGRFE